MLLHRQVKTALFAGCV